MAALEAVRQSNISAGDWQGEQLPAGGPSNVNITTVREECINTDVCVKENGRLDINFRSQKPWLTTLMKRVEQSLPQVIESGLESDDLNEDNLQFPLNLNIVMQVVGSRGDVQPFVERTCSVSTSAHGSHQATGCSTESSFGKRRSIVCLMTDPVVGVARIPGRVVGLFHGSQSTTLQKDYRGREWAMYHLAECLSNQKQKEKTQHDEAAVHPQSQGDLHGNAIDGLEADQRISDTAGIAPVEDEEAHFIGSTHGKSNLAMEEAQRMTYDKGVGQAKHVLSETRYHAIKSEKFALNFVLVLPTDLKLSLSKGFHNAPRLYPDDTVHSIPNVIGIKSGLRAAGKEMPQGLNNRISRLITQPSLGFQKSGGQRLLKEFGKAVGGVVLKPTAGLFGLAGYPLNGLHKHVRRSLSKSKSKEIIRSRITQGFEEMCTTSPEE